MSNPRLVNFSLAISPDIPLQVADRPLSDKDAKITFVDPQQFAQSVGMKQWCQSSLVSYSSHPESLECMQKYEVLTKHEFISIIFSSLLYANKMALCKINDSVGFGVFATDEIPKNTYVGIYTGQLSYVTVKKNNESTSNYIFFVRPSDEKQHGVNIDAEHYGNITRFFNHLPLAKEEVGPDHVLSDHEFKQPSRINDVATANVAQGMFMYNGLPINTFRTTRNIHKHEQIGFSYGFQYWASIDKAPGLFFKNGQVVPLSEYTINPLTFIRYHDNVSQQDEMLMTRTLTRQDLRQLCQVEGIIFPVNNGECEISNEKLMSSLRSQKTPQLLEIDLEPKDMKPNPSLAQQSIFAKKKPVTKEQEKQDKTEQNKAQHPSPAAKNAATHGGEVMHNRRNPTMSSRVD